MNPFLEAAKKAGKSIGLDTRALYQRLSARSIEAAIREQGLSSLRDQCRGIIPDLRRQYTQDMDPAEYERYWQVKLGGLHAFQVDCMLEAVRRLGRKNLVLVDIGDSSGSHGRYISRLSEPGTIGKVVSVNLDPVAVEKVRALGNEAVCCRAEDLRLETPVDLLMSFEMVEHLTDPVRFLHGLAVSSNSQHLLMTVPYRASSRVGLAELRNDDLSGKMTAEGVHIFELCPEDWLLLARFAGWKPVFTRTYWQYPRYSPLRLTAPLWRAIDFEGFWGVFLEKDLRVAERYQDW